MLKHHEDEERGLDLFCSVGVACGLVAASPCSDRLKKKHAVPHEQREKHLRMDVEHWIVLVA